MPFTLVDDIPHTEDPLSVEQSLLARAAGGAALAHLWQAPTCLVVPRSYLRFTEFEPARARFAQEGCPVHLRLSGGGLVPQGPGILNLSLAYPLRGTMGTMADAVYLHLCDILRFALATLGVETHWQAVEGSFCDGRFNLAWGPRDDARKIAGTAQYWRRTGDHHVVLAHAVLLVDADPVGINARANAFEAAIGSGREYAADRVVSVREALEAAGQVVPEDLMRGMEGALRAVLAGAPLPVEGGGG